MTVASNYDPTKQLGNGVTTSFSYSFDIASVDDIVVYQRIGDVQSIVPSTDYTVEVQEIEDEDNPPENPTPTGNVVFNTAPAAGTIIVIDRKTPQTQETPYKTSSGFPAVRVEQNFDKLTLMVQELQYDVSRSPKVDETSSIDPEELVGQIERIYTSIDNVDTVADDIANVNTVALDTTNIDTVAGNISNVNTVSAVSGNVTTVAGSISNVNTVAGDINRVNLVADDIASVHTVAVDINNVIDVAANKTNIDTVAGISSDVTTVSGISADVTAVSGISTDVSSVASNETNINTVASDIADVNAVAGDIAKVTAVADDLTNIDAVADDLTNIDTVATNISDVNAVGGDIAKVTAVADDLTNIDAVNANKTNIDTVAGISSDVTTVSGISTDVSTVAGIASDVSAVEDIASDVSTVSGIASDVSAVADNAADISAVAADLTNIDNVAGDLTNINAVAADLTNIDAVVGNATNINNVAADLTNINSVAADLTNINSVAADLTNIDNASAYAAEAKQWAIGDPSEPTGGSAKYWAGQAAAGQVQADWTEADTTAKSYIKNKPTVDASPTQYSTNLVQSGGVFTATNNLQTQIDAIVSSSDVFDIVGTYAELQAYDISTVPVNDIIKVLVDSTHSNAATYYRCVSVGGVKSWSYIGSEGAYYTKAEADAAFQATLVSGTNIKTINNNSILGSGNVDIDALPSQTGQSGKFLTTDGTDASWANVDALPSQTGQSGKFLTTDGTDASWANVDALPSQTGQSGKFLTTDGTDASWANVPTRNIGEIVESTIPLTDAGLHLLDGSLISGSGAYSAFVTYISGLVSDYPSLFETEADWQTAVSTYGVCGKFVYDSVNNTVRLPKYSNKIYTSEIASTAGVKGNGNLVGLKKYTAPFSGFNGDYTIAGNNIGAPTNDDYVGAEIVTRKRTTVNHSEVNYGISTDSSKSGIVADLSNITTALEGYWYIVIATSTKTDIEVDIDEIATDLNGKADADLSNVSSVGKERCIGWGIPDYTTGTNISSGYVATHNGVILFSYNSQTGGSVNINGTSIYTPVAYSSERNSFTFFIPVQKGDVFTYTTGSNYIAGSLKFFKLKGEA